jgi:hypothetical protein
MKTAIHIFAATTLIIISANVGCKNDESPVVIQPKPDVILPLEINNQWAYKLSYFDSTGTMTEVDTFTNRVVKDTVIFGETWAYTTYWGICKNRSDGCWYVLLQPTLLYKYPATINDIFTRGQDTVRVVSTNLPVTVPLGTFPCYDYQSTFYGLPFHSFLSPKIGLVKGEWVSRVNYGTPYVSARLELINCTIQ